ncbi:MAG: PIN domain-containing protein [Deltaproteobacteria bacterium]|nr:PIN domain-containing protein [Deltaproteobacteria bacterium]
MTAMNHCGDAVLVDTSVWLEFFKRKSSLDIAPLELLIEERRVATCLPIRAEILSGEIPAKPREALSQSFEAMLSVDPDWKSFFIWQKVVHLALECRRRKIGLPGIVDRMILVAAQESGAVLWTLDRKLKNLALSLSIPVSNPSLQS